MTSPLLPPGLPPSSWHDLGIGPGTSTAAPAPASSDAARSFDLSGPAPGTISPSGTGPDSAQHGASQIAGFLLRRDGSQRA